MLTELKAVAGALVSSAQTSTQHVSVEEKELLRALVRVTECAFPDPELCKQLRFLIEACVADLSS